METVNKKPSTQSDHDLISWLRLIRSENIGPATFHDLVHHYGSIDEALYNLPSLGIKSTKGRPFIVCSEAKAYEEVEKHKKIGAQLITLADNSYPVLLSQIDDPPPVLSIIGNKTSLSRKSLGIVGARNASIHGRNFAHKLAFDLGSQGWWIPSGLARGIDTAAHEGAMSTGTTAVLASGIDYIYPAENEKIYRRICEQGCIISEAPFGAKPQSHFFPRRNRIISGLSKGVIIVEAALKSGSLITARFANEQGRDVFAVPGSPFDPRCRGTNVLIRQGATLIQSSEDVVEHYYSLFNPMALQEKTPLYLVPKKQINLEQDNNGLKKKIIENLSFVPISLDELTRQCQTTPECIQGAVIELELAGKVFRSSGSQIALAVGE